MKFKVDYVREQFPAFSEPSLKRWAHFENAGGSYVAQAVNKRLRKYARENRVQPYYSYPASKEAGKMMDESYQALAEILNVPEDWVHIGASTTANTYTVAQAMRGYLQADENIIVTNQDHEANSGYWRRLVEAGIEVREWSVNQDAQLNAKDLWPLIDAKTRFVAFPHVSNIVGQINPVEEICAELRKRNVLSIVDGVSFAPHAWPDIKALGSDVYFFSTYKTYGPHQGVMVISPELAWALPNQAHSFNAEELRKRFNPAGPDHAQVAGISGIAKYIGDVFEKHAKTEAPLSEMARSVSQWQRQYENKRLEQFLEGLASIEALRLVGSKTTEGRVPTVSLYHEEKSGQKLAKALSKHGVMAAGGNFYAPRVLEALGLDAEHGVLRLSMVHYNTEQEVEKVLKALRAILT